MEYNNIYEKTVLCINAITVTGISCFFVLFKSSFKNYGTIAMTLIHWRTLPLVGMKTFRIGNLALDTNQHFIYISYFMWNKVLKSLGMKWGRYSTSCFPNTTLYGVIHFSQVRV